MRVQKWLKRSTHTQDFKTKFWTCVINCKRLPLRWFDLYCLTRMNRNQKSERDREKYTEMEYNIIKWKIIWHFVFNSQQHLLFANFQLLVLQIQRDFNFSFNHYHFGLCAHHTLMHTFARWFFVLFNRDLHFSKCIRFVEPIMFYMKTHCVNDYVKRKQQQKVEKQQTMAKTSNCNHITHYYKNIWVQN